MWQEIFAEVVEVVLWSSTLEIRIEWLAFSERDSIDGQETDRDSESEILL